MLFDLNESDGPVTEFDVCIMGAGPAGITVALKLAEANKKVLLLEGGGLSWSEASQKLYECKSTGLDAWPENLRLRYFGGTSNHWAGRCRPLEESDFLATHFGNIPGWPITYDEIVPYLKEAMDIVELEAKGFIPISSGIENSGFVADRFANSPPTRFGEKYLGPIRESEYISLCLHANVLAIDFKNPGQTVENVKIKNQVGKVFTFGAQNYVLSMGGIENARFLLNQTKDLEAGIGNETGMVGKCFMEHMNVMLGEFILKDPNAAPPFQYFTSDEFTRDHKTGKSNVTFNQVEEIKSYGRTAKIKSFFKNLACDWNLEDKLQFISDFECPGTGVITTLMEQSPGKQSYVGLSDEVDGFDMKKAVLHWQLNDNDIQTIRTIAFQIAKSFAESGLGVVKLKDYILDDNLTIPVNPHAHHMGTTRMASSPVDGVVDKNCRVYGTNNLFIAGSSIFSSGGACNPTLPLIQFAIRLADHLKKSS